MSKYPEGKFERHPLNVPGPFYVENGPCITCHAPATQAPELFGFFEEPPELRGYSHCYVRRQPATPDELNRMLQAIEAACCSGLRYCGDDPAILGRLERAGFGSRCDELWDDSAAPEPRTPAHTQPAAPRAEPPRG